MGYTVEHLETSRAEGFQPLPVLRAVLGELLGFAPPSAHLQPGVGGGGGGAHQRGHGQRGGQEQGKGTSHGCCPPHWMPSPLNQ